ncbi:heparinase, partial [Cribrihabitans sp. XS_ASV171]
MSSPNSMASRWVRFQNRVHARLSRRHKAVTAFVTAPEPRTVGSFARGRQLVAGNLLFAGYLVESKDTPLWDIKSPNAAFDAERHG